MSWEGRDRCFLVGAQPYRFAAVATVFRGKDKLVLPKIKVNNTASRSRRRARAAPAPPPADWRQALAYRGAASFPAAGRGRAWVANIRPAESNAIPSPLRSPVAKRAAGEKRCPVR